MIKIAIETVGTRVFITEAGGDLEIAVDTTHHEELLKLLRSLRQGVEFAGMETGRDEKVASTFGGGVGENWGGDFGEIVVIHIIANKTIKFGTALQNILHGGATKVEITILETKFFGRFFAVVVSVDWEWLGFVEKSELVNNEFDFAGGDVGIDELGSALAHFAGGF